MKNDNVDDDASQEELSGRMRLRKATIVFRDDGKFDVLRERHTGNGETLKGWATLEEAFDAVRAGCEKRLDSKEKP